MTKEGKSAGDGGRVDYPLAPLRAFREVAKCGSFTLAAARLQVTQGAVSNHIRTLEQHYQTRLFHREGRKIDLTIEGRLLYDGLDKAFSVIEQSMQSLQAGKIKQRLVLGVLSSFATKWLLPRLGGFYEAHPNIELTVRSVNHTIDVEREAVDLAVATLPAAPSSETVDSALMWQEQLFVVCSPGYRKAHVGRFNNLDQLKNHILLHDETEIAAERGFDWATWLRHFRHEQLLYHATSHYFSQSDLVLQAAMRGYGLALTRTSIAATDLDKGALVNPFPKKVISTHAACYLCGKKAIWRESAVSAFREWLLAEAGSRD